MMDRFQRAMGGPIRRLNRIEREPATQKIMRESVKILIFASVISSLGGFGLELLRDKLVVLVPLLILFPALNEMTGGLGAVMTSRITSALNEKKLRPSAWRTSPMVRGLFRDVLGVTVITSIFIACVAYLVGWVRGFPFHWLLLTETIALSLFVGVLLFGVLFCVSVFGSVYAFKNGHDPDNYLIPLCTAIGDVGSMGVLALALAWMF